MGASEARPVTVRVTIDGRSAWVTPDQTLLAAAAAIGITVPTLCHDERLRPSGACRMCLVNVEGTPHPVAACTTPVSDGMVIATASADLEQGRRTILQLLARTYPRTAVDARPDLPFHRLLKAYGVVADASSADAPGLVDRSHPAITVDLSQCISCWRCVRICDEVQGQDVWHIEERGARAKVVPDSGERLGDSSCVSCGACVDTCPTGALADAGPGTAGAPTGWTRTTCPYCGVGCELLVGTREDRITEVRPAADAPVNRGHACVKGRYAFGFVSAHDRLRQPLLRVDGELVSRSWDEVIGTVAARLRAVQLEHGPDAVGILGSARVTNEENYLTQKLARVVLDTNNVDCCARVCHAPSAAGLGAMLGTGAATNAFDDIERAATLLVCGANATESHPVVGARIRQAARAGAHLIVIDPRRIELAAEADVHLAVRPGANVLLLNALAHVVIAEGLVAEDFLRERVEGLDDYVAHLSAYDPEIVADRCGVDATAIRAAARLYATSGPAMIMHGLGVTEHRQGTDGVMCLVNLALLTGNIGRPGAGVNPLRGQNNVQGSAHMGCTPDRLPGYVRLAAGKDRAGAVWGRAVPDRPGLDAMQMIDAAAAGDLRALWVIGWDLLPTQPGIETTRSALERLDLLVVQDIFLNETARELATVVLPAASSFEKDGTFMNAERRVQRVRRAVAPPGQARTDADILCAVAAALGHAESFTYGSAEQVWDEVRAVWPAGAGLSYERLDGPGGRQWPCHTVDHPGTALLHGEDFPELGARARLRCIAFEPTPEQPDHAYPYTLITGRSLNQFNAGTMTGRSITQQLRPHDLLEIGPDDALDLALADGERVRVDSRYGTAELAALITDRVPHGVVYATFNEPASGVNRLTGPHRDHTTNTPEYKVTAVALSTTGDQGQSTAATRLVAGPTARRRPT